MKDKGLWFSSHVAPELPNQPTVEHPTTNKPQPTEIKPPVIYDTTQLDEFRIIAKSSTYDPNELRAKKGDLVRIRIGSVDVRYDFKIPGYNIAIDLNPNEEQLVEFVADKVGTFDFYCSVYCGSKINNMRGQLIVEQ